MHKDKFIYVIILITVFQILFSFFFQGRITYNEGLEWDGRYYYEVAELFSRSETITTEEPFGHRILLPILASKVNPDNIIEGFLTINLLALCFQLLLLYQFFNQYSDRKKLMTIIIFLYSFSVYSSYRFAFFAPLSPDYWTINIILLFLILSKYIQNVQTIKSKLMIMIGLVLLSIVGTLLREIFIIVSMGLIFIFNPIIIEKNLFQSGWKTIKNLLFQSYLLVPFIISIFTFKIMYGFINPSESKYTTLSHAWAMFYGKPIDHYFVALFIAFGSSIYLALIKPKISLSFLFKNQYIFFLLSIFLVLGFIGGTATFRLLYWVSPIMYLLAILTIPKLMEEKNYFLLAVIFGIHFLSQRLHFPILPDYVENLPYSLPIFTPFDLKPPLLDLYANGEKFIYRIQFFQYLIAGIFIIAYNCYYERFFKSKNINTIN
jgi:hypothetical protein